MTLTEYYLADLESEDKTVVLPPSVQINGDEQMLNAYTFVIGDLEITCTSAGETYIKEKNDYPTIKIHAACTI